MVYSDEIAQKIDCIIEELQKEHTELENKRWYALKLLEQDQEITEKYGVNLPDVIDRSYESDIINEKYDFIEEIIAEVLFHKEERAAFTDKIDQFLTHKVASIPIFLAVMACVFFLTFTVGDWLKGYFELLIEFVSIGATATL